MDQTKTVFTWLNIANNKSQSKPDLAFKLIKEELEELEEAYLSGNRDEQLDAIADLHWVVDNFPYLNDFTVKEVEDKLLQVAKSNFSKFCYSEDEAIETVNLYESGKHPDKEGEIIKAFFTKEVFDDKPCWVIKRLSDGKILKSKNYKKPNEY